MHATTPVTTLEHTERHDRITTITIGTGDNAVVVQTTPTWRPPEDGGTIRKGQRSISISAPESIKVKIDSAPAEYPYGGPGNTKLRS